MKQIEIIKKSTIFLDSLRIGDIILVDRKLIALFEKIVEALSYRVPLNVTEYICYPANINGSSEAFDLCPKCDTPINRGYQQFCSACGQHLKWINQHKMKISFPRGMSFE